MVTWHTSSFSRRLTPLWVLLLGMHLPRTPRAGTVCDDAEALGHRDRRRWKRSLRAPMVFRALKGLFGRNVTERRAT